MSLHYITNFLITNKLNITNEEMKEAIILISIGMFIGFLLRRTVTIYNYDYEGMLRRIGYSYMFLKRDGYYVYIPKKIRLRAYTNRYLVVPDEFSWGWYEGIDVFVNAGNENRCVPLSDEMEVVF